MYVKFIKGIITSFIFTLAFFFIFSIILRFTNISDNTIPGIILLISIISILCGAAVCTKNASNQGWLWGSSVGFTYALILYLLSSLTLTGFYFPLSTLYLILGYTAIGAIGGIIGINM